MRVCCSVTCSANMVECTVFTRELQHNAPSLVVPRGAGTAVCARVLPTGRQCVICVDVLKCD